METIEVFLPNKFNYVEREDDIGHDFTPKAFQDKASILKTSENTYQMLIKSKDGTDFRYFFINMGGIPGSLGSWLVVVPNQRVAYEFGDLTDSARIRYIRERFQLAGGHDYNVLSCAMQIFENSIDIYKLGKKEKIWNVKKTEGGEQLFLIIRCAIIDAIRHGVACGRTCGVMHLDLPNEKVNEIAHQLIVDIEKNNSDTYI